jgi:hypothetical protein
MLIVTLKRCRVRAESDYGKRLNIRKATLRKWRRAFVSHLRNHGVVSKATRRSTREQARMSKLKGIYRPARTPRAFPQKVAHAFVKVRPPNSRASLNDSVRDAVRVNAALLVIADLPKLDDANGPIFNSR